MWLVDLTWCSTLTTQHACLHLTTRHACLHLSPKPHLIRKLLYTYIQIYTLPFIAIRNHNKFENRECEYQYWSLTLICHPSLKPSLIRTLFMLSSMLILLPMLMSLLMPLSMLICKRNFLRWRGDIPGPIRIHGRRSCDGSERGHSNLERARTAYARQTLRSMLIRDKSTCRIVVCMLSTCFSAVKLFVFIFDCGITQG